MRRYIIELLYYYHAIIYSYLSFKHIAHRLRLATELLPQIIRFILFPLSVGTASWQ